MAAISTVVEMLGDLLINKVRFLQGVEEQVQLLKDELNRMQSFLRDANKKLAKDERMSKNPSSRCPRYHRNFPFQHQESEQEGPSPDLYVFPQARVSSRQNRERDKSRDRYGIKDTGEASDSERRRQVDERRRLDPWGTEEHLVGVDDDVKKLLDFILDGEMMRFKVCHGVRKYGHKSWRRNRRKMDEKEPKSWRNCSRVEMRGVAAREERRHGPRTQISI